METRGLKKQLQSGQSGARLYHGNVQNLTQVREILERSWGRPARFSPAVLDGFAAAARPILAEDRLSELDFFEFVAARLDDEAEFEPTRAADLALVFACAHGGPRALARFEHTYGDRLRASLRKMGLSAGDVQAAMQKARAELFVAEPGTAARIAKYSGKGDLGGWLRVTVTRSALKMFRGQRPASLEEERLGAELVARGASDEPELAYMRELYRPVFRRAFSDALGCIDAADRALLKQNLLDRVSIDRLAVMHQVHRATVARRVARAREQLISETRKRFQMEARVTKEECESIFRAFGDAFEITLRKFG